MKPLNHILLGLFFSLTIFLIDESIGIIGFTTIFLSSFLIDFDHCIYYSWKKRDLNPLNAYKWFIKKFQEDLLKTREERNKTHQGVYIFHGLEVLVILFILSFWFKPLLFVFSGFAFHLLLDMIYQPVLWDRFSKISLINDFLNYKI